MTRFFPEDSILAPSIHKSFAADFRFVTKRGATFYHHDSISSDKAWWIQG